MYRHQGRALALGGGGGCPALKFPWQLGAPQADYAVVWAPPQQFMDEQAGPKALFNIGAGGMRCSLRLPPQALVVRLDDAGMAADGRICALTRSSAISASSMATRPTWRQAAGLPQTAPAQRLSPSA